MGPGLLGGAVRAWMALLDLVSGICRLLRAVRSGLSMGMRRALRCCRQRRVRDGTWHAR
jgi:hypothetical protein